ncbi:hypothetical protein [Roseibium sp. SCP14]|uniref:hypothetical protein n=1 Tax=Roseibium sp. SCP14 TaxID=3141375 RepID=UPI00333C3626
MFEPQAPKKDLRETVRDTFTPSRVGLLSWAFAAVIMGTVGLASYQFGTQPLTQNSARLIPSGLPLPPAGDIETTASIGRETPVEIYQIQDNEIRYPSKDLEQSQIEVLQREIAGLRRRLIALSEQNISYSRRISELEKQVSITGPAQTESLTESVDPTIEPVPGVIKTEIQPPSRPQSELVIDPAPSGSPTAENAKKVSDTIAEMSEPDLQTRSHPPRVVALDQKAEVSTPTEPPFQASREPVRIVTLPQGTDEPVTTGSIPAPTQAPTLEGFDQAPTQTVLAPTVVTPSEPSGRVNGQIKRSDFGAVIGHFSTTAGAAKAWADFKSQNEERMRDLRPLLLERQVAEGGVSLLIGPFGNAADAAIACFQLLETTELCHPAVYAGDSLVTAAEFRDTAL